MVILSNAYSPLNTEISQLEVSKNITCAHNIYVKLEGTSNSVFIVLCQICQLQLELEQTNMKDEICSFL